MEVASFLLALFLEEMGFLYDFLLKPADASGYLNGKLYSLRGKPADLRLLSASGPQGTGNLALQSLNCS